MKNPFSCGSSREDQGFLSSEGNSLPAFLTPGLDDFLPALTAHPDQETVGFPAFPVVGLKGSLHDRALSLWN